MKKLSFAICLLGLSASVFAEKKTVQFNGVSCQYEIDKGMLNGQYRSFYSNGKPKCEGSFSQNNRIGFWVFYQADGAIQCIRQYNDNYNFEQKNAKNQASVVKHTPTAAWKTIAEKDIISRTRITAVINKKDNGALFNEIKMGDQLTNLLKSSDQAVYADARFANIIGKDVLLNKEIVGFQIKEDRILDKTTRVLQYRITGIAPLVQANDGLTTAPVCWIYYPQLMAALQHIQVSKDIFPLADNLLEIFENRLFAAETKDVELLPTSIRPTVEPGTYLPYADIMDIEEENSMIIQNFAVK